jgi:IclR family pca regulon transcriptional regulator
MATPLNGSILRAFEILRLVQPDRPELTAARLGDELGLNAATAHRFLATLEEAGALVAVRRGTYRLGLGAAELGRMAEATNPIAPHVQPLIEALRDALRESVMVCRLGRAGPVCVAVAPADRPITVSINVGTTLDMLGSAQGRLWLAEMPEARRAAWLSGAPEPAELARIRTEGVALNLGDAEPDIAAVAAPIRDRRGACALTLSAFGPLTRFTPEAQARIRAQVLATAERIEAGLAGG